LGGGAGASTAARTDLIIKYPWEDVVWENVFKM